MGRIISDIQPLFEALESAVHRVFIGVQILFFIYIKINFVGVEGDETSGIILWYLRSYIVSGTSYNINK